jgi:hypothetical protein
VDDYDIYIRGFDKGGVEPTEIGLSRVFGLDPQRARELLRSLPRVVKRHVPAEQMGRYVLALRELGADLELRRSAILPAQTIAVRGGEHARDAADSALHGSTLTLPPPNEASIAGTASDVRDENDAGDDTVPDPRTPPRAVGPPKWDAPTLQSPGGWKPIEPSPLRANEGELPDPSQVPGLRLDGRPAWLVEGPHSVSPEPADGDQEGFGVSLPPRPASERPSARAGPPRSATRRMTVGTVGRELATGPSALSRWALRAGIFVSLLVMLAALQKSHVLERAQREFARFVARGKTGATDDDEASPANIHGPDAAQWLEPELHQVNGGDKDRVRGLVQRFIMTGAVGVHVGHISHSGALQIAGELIVELPDDAAGRKAVLAEYQRFLEATFPGLAVAASDPGGDLLRVAL